MNILSASQIRELDRQTMALEPISSIDLMERAAGVFVRWLSGPIPDTRRQVIIFCGPGNNGGDGLAVGRLLANKGYSVEVVVCQIGKKRSEECTINLNRLQAECCIVPHILESDAPFPEIPQRAVVIDAILGSGLSRPVVGYWAELLRYLNEQKCLRVAIDIPSGLFADRPTTGVTFQAHHTMSFELPKLAFLMPENAFSTGRWVCKSIGLNRSALEAMDSPLRFVEAHEISGWLHHRQTFAHKGTFGHALIVAGKRGKTGAAILAARAALRAGSGLVTLHVPRTERQAVHAAVPEAMVSADVHDTCFSGVQELPADTYTTIGIGCGLGTNAITKRGFQALLEQVTKPMVIDADALNILAEEPDLFAKVPPHSILTPHPGEYKRLFKAPSANGFETIETLREHAARLGVFIILKGAYTAIAAPDGRLSFNSTGNPGMATAGSGDVLTGILTGLLAQNYSPKQAAILGVYLHGLAGDLAIKQHQSLESLIAGDLIRQLGSAFQFLRSCRSAL